MQSDWAAENLRVIRTLMERSTVYRCALAPMTLLAGSLGTGAALVGWWLGIASPRAFVLYWLAVAAVTLVGVSLLVRRQALQAGEPFWSPPARRVARAALPAFVAALCVTIGALVALESMHSTAGPPELVVRLLPVGWVLFYGLALNAAGFFMPRGIQFFGWIVLVLGGLALMALSASAAFPLTGHGLMGTCFGLLHLAYGLYLAFTEGRGSRP